MTWQGMTREDKITAIEPLLAQGWSGSEIGAKLSAPSRSAVIGFISRWMKDARRPAGGSLVMQVKAARDRGRPRLPAKKLKPVAAKYIPVDPIRFDARDMLTQCAFIAGEPSADAMCCGAEAAFGSSWCSHHIKTVFAISPPRRNPSKFVGEGA